MYKKLPISEFFASIQNFMEYIKLKIERVLQCPRKYIRICRPSLRQKFFLMIDFFAGVGESASCIRYDEEGIIASGYAVDWRFGRLKMLMEGVRGAKAN